MASTTSSNNSISRSFSGDSLCSISSNSVFHDNNSLGDESDDAASLLFDDDFKSPKSFSQRGKKVFNLKKLKKLSITSPMKRKSPKKGSGKKSTSSDLTIREQNMSPKTQEKSQKPTSLIKSKSVQLEKKSLDKSASVQLDTRSIDDASTLFKLGALCITNGDFEKARKNMNECLHIRVRLKGHDHYSVASAHDKLGDIALVLEELDEAVSHYNDAVQIARSKDDNDSKRFASELLLKKGDVMLQNKTKDAAIDCFDDAVLLGKEVAGEDDEEVAAILIKIALLFLSSNDQKLGVKYYSKATNYFPGATPSDKQILGCKPEDAITSLRHIGFVHYTRGNYEHALTCYDDAWAVMCADKSDFKITLELTNHKVDAYLRKKELDEAIQCYKNFLYLAQDETGHDTDIVATMLYKMGKIYSRMHLDDEALKCFKKEGKIREKIGSNPRHVARVLVRVGILYRERRNYKKALSFYEEALKNLTKVLEKFTHDSTKEENNSLQYRLKICEEGLPLQDVVLVSPRDLAETVNDLGNLYQSVGSYYNALSCYQSCLRMYYNKTEPIAIKQNMGFTLLKMKSYNEAVECFEDVKRLQQEKVDNDAGIADTVLLIKRIQKTIRREGRKWDSKRAERNSRGIEDL